MPSDGAVTAHRHGFPTLLKLIDHYQDNDEVAFVAVQTPFEGFASNTVERAKQTADRYGLTIPVGHSGTAGQISPMMRRYRTPRPRLLPDRVEARSIRSDSTRALH